MEICSNFREAGRETYGRFDLGEYYGVFRFYGQKESPDHCLRDYDDNIDKFLLDASDNPSQNDPIRCYRWRGQDYGMNIIQLSSETRLYTMMFFHGGRKV